MQQLTPTPIRHLARHPLQPWTSIPTHLLSSLSPNYSGWRHLSSSTLKQTRTERRVKRAVHQGRAEEENQLEQLQPHSQEEQEPHLQQQQSPPLRQQTRPPQQQPKPPQQQQQQQFTHVNASGSAHMVSVGEKPVTRRVAIAVAAVRFSKPRPVNLIRQNAMSKGDVLSVARIAGLMAAKNTPNMIPLCHPIGITHADVAAEIIDPHSAHPPAATDPPPATTNNKTQRKAPSSEKTDEQDHESTAQTSSILTTTSPHFPKGGVLLTARVECISATGVEMEALVSANAAALTVYDMCKGVDKYMTLNDSRVVLKSGGRSANWVDAGWLLQLAGIQLPTDVDFNWRQLGADAPGLEGADAPGLEGVVASKEQRAKCLLTLSNAGFTADEAKALLACIKTEQSQENENGLDDDTSGEQRGNVEVETSGRDWKKETPLFRKGPRMNYLVTGGFEEQKENNTSTDRSLQGVQVRHGAPTELVNDAASLLPAENVKQKLDGKGSQELGEEQQTDLDNATSAAPSRRASPPSAIDTLKAKIGSWKKEHYKMFGLPWLSDSTREQKHAVRDDKRYVPAVQLSRLLSINPAHQEAFYYLDQWIPKKSVINASLEELAQDLLEYREKWIEEERERKASSKEDMIITKGLRERRATSEERMIIAKVLHEQAADTDEDGSIPDLHTHWQRLERIVKRLGIDDPSVSNWVPSDESKSNRDLLDEWNSVKKSLDKQWNGIRKWKMFTENPDREMTKRYWELSLMKPFAACVRVAKRLGMLEPDLNVLSWKPSDEWKSDEELRAEFSEHVSVVSDNRKRMVIQARAEWAQSRMSSLRAVKLTARKVRMETEKEKAKEMRELKKKRDRMRKEAKARDRKKRSAISWAKSLEGHPLPDVELPKFWKPYIPYWKSNGLPK